MLGGDLGTVCATAARIFGVLVCLPIGDALQLLPRLLISLCFGIALSSPLNPQTVLQWHTPLTEFMIGLILAAPIRMFADVAELLGELIDTARGQTIGSVLDPLNGQQVSDMAGILRVGATVLVILVGGFDRVIEEVSASYTYLPLGQAAVPEGMLCSILHKGVALVSSACALSSVWLLVYLLSDLAAALLSKVSPGLSFVSSASVVKMVLTIILLLNLAWHPRQIEDMAKGASTSLAAGYRPAQSHPTIGAGRS